MSEKFQVLEKLVFGPENGPERKAREYGNFMSSKVHHRVGRARKYYRTCFAQNARSEVVHLFQRASLITIGERDEDDMSRADGSHAHCR